jgi:hypothetical protein
VARIDTIECERAGRTLAGATGAHVVDVDRWIRARGLRRYGGSASWTVSWVATLWAWPSHSGPAWGRAARVVPHV